MPETTLTWLGHATFRFDTPSGKRIYIDPFLNGNPKCPESELEPERIDVIALTHGHGDHLGDTVELAKKHGCTVIAPVEMADWLQGKQGVENVLDPNKGGTVEAAGVKFTLTNAHHSSSNNDLEYMGEPVGIVAAIENGPKLYFAGDTCVFGDMQIIRRLYEPDVAILPIGGHSTIDPRAAEAAVVDGLDFVRRAAEGFRAGRRVAVRAWSREEVRAALARPGVAAGLGREERRDLLELDLTKLTYG